MKGVWSQLINTFEVNTRGSARKMLKLANHHLSRLEAAKADEGILALYTPFHAAVQVFQNLMVQWMSGRNIGKGNTVSFTDLLDKMATTSLPAWEIKVYDVYPKGTPEATAIFPNYKTPFRKAPYDERMIMLEALHTTLLNYPLLKHVSDDVAVKLAELNEARQTQTEQFGKVGFSSSMVEDQRKVLADLMDDNLCMLRIKYRKTNILMAENYFDLSLLRRVATDSDAVFRSSGTVEAGTTMAVILPEKLPMGTNATCNFGNKSNTVELQFFFSNSASAADSTHKTAVLPNETVEGLAADSGWAPGAKYIIVKNPGTVAVEYDLMVVEAVS
jgi:hypothetical protein